MALRLATSSIRARMVNLIAIDITHACLKLAFPGRIGAALTDSSVCSRGCASGVRQLAASALQGREVSDAELAAAAEGAAAALWRLSCDLQEEDPWEVRRPLSAAIAQPLFFFFFTRCSWPLQDLRLESAGMACQQVRRYPHFCRSAAFGHATCESVHAKALETRSHECSLCFLTLPRVRCVCMLAVCSGSS